MEKPDFSEAQTLRDISLKIGEHAIRCRAAIDHGDAYDPYDDYEGYAMSVLIGLRHWADKAGEDWGTLIEEVEASFNDDLSEAQELERQWAKEN